MDVETAARLGAEDGPARDTWTRRRRRAPAAAEIAALIVEDPDTFRA